MNDYEKRSWTEINLTQLQKNYQICRGLLPMNKKVMAVVKADGYGHGDVEVAQALEEMGVMDFAVSNVHEGIRLRQSGIKGSILILGYTPLEYGQKLFDYDLMQTLISESYADAFAKMNIPVKCQFAIDTGMNRIGLNADELEYCEDIIRDFSKKVNLIGVYTHLCVADCNTENELIFTNDQIIKFDKLANLLEDLNFAYIHCLNSAGSLWHDSEISNFVRLGIILYGLKPNSLNVLPNGIKPILTWKSVVSMVKTIRAGASIGYGRSYVADHDMRVATIPTGYADGYNRMLSNQGYVLINGEKAFVVGRVCMDQFMVDVTEIDSVNMGTEVVLIGECGKEHISADDIADMIETIGYEIVCDMGKRVPRLYKRDGNDN